MKSPLKYPPLLLTIALVIVFLAMVLVQQNQTNRAYITVSYEQSYKVNQPGPTEKKKSKSVEYDGIPVFLNEDLREEETKAAAQLTSNSEDIESEFALLNQMTKKESLNEEESNDRFLILAGAYTDNMILLSKQAQYANRGLNAEILRFEDQEKRHICLGRFDNESLAETFAKEIAEQLEISIYVLDKDK